MRYLLNHTTPNLLTYILSLLTCTLSFLPMTAISGDRLLGTGGVNQVEGAGGGGLTPWALISGYGTDKQIGVSAFYTHAQTRGHFKLNTIGIAAGLYNRVELSASQSRFGLGTTVPGETIHLNTLGAKIRLTGDAIYDQDQWLPQISAGIQYKYHEDYHFVPKALGATHSSGIDYYLAASKLFLGALQGYNLLLNADLRATKANQFGILGFGGDKNDHYRIYPEASAAVMLSDDWLLGSEIRYKPNNLSVYKENKAYDVFMTWFPVKNISLTGAYINLGNIADKDHQNGWYLSGQLTY